MYQVNVFSQSAVGQFLPDANGRFMAMNIAELSSIKLGRKYIELAMKNICQLNKDRKILFDIFRRLVR